MQADKRRTVAESYQPGTSVALVARRNAVIANLVFNWRRQFCVRERDGFLRTLPALNDTALDAATTMRSPVRGFRLLRAERFLLAKLPKPVVTTVSRRRKRLADRREHCADGGRHLAVQNVRLPQQTHGRLSLERSPTIPDPPRSEIQR